MTHTRIALIIGCLLSFLGNLHGDNIKKDSKELITSQMTMMNDLIEMTQRTLEAEVEIKTLLGEYLTVQEAYIQNPNDKELVVRMVKMAHKLLTNIQNHHLTYQFDPDFISELSLFSKIANKKGIPAPK